MGSTATGGLSSASESGVEQSGGRERVRLAAPPAMLLIQQHQDWEGYGYIKAMGNRYGECQGEGGSL